MTKTESIQVVEIGDNTDPNLEYGTYRGLAVEVNGTFEAKVASLDEARTWIGRNYWPVELKPTHSADYVQAWDAVDIYDRPASMVIGFDPAEDLHLSGALPVHEDDESPEAWDAVEKAIETAISTWTEALETATKAYAAENGVEIEMAFYAPDRLTCHPMDADGDTWERHIWQIIQDNAYQASA